MSERVVHRALKRNWFTGRMTTLCGLVMERSVSADWFSRKCPVCVRLHQEAKQQKGAKR